MFGLFLFIVLPVLGLIISLSDLRKPQNALIFISFYALSGYCQHFALITADITRIGWAFQNAHPENALEYFAEGHSADLYIQFLFSSILPITNNPKIFCAIAATIYGILSYLITVRIYRYWPNRFGATFFLLVLVALSNVSLVHFTGLRFYTGAQFVILGCLQYCQGRRSGALLVCVGPLIHFTLIIALSAFVIWLLCHKLLRSNILIKWILCGTFAFSFLNLGSAAFKQFNEFDVENRMINVKVKAYTDDSGIQKREGQVSTYRAANSAFTKTFNMVSRCGLLIALLVLNSASYIVVSRSEKNLYLLIVIFAAISFIGIGVSEHFIRFVNLTWAIFFVFLTMIYRRNPDMKITKWVSGLAIANFYSIAFLLINYPRLVDSEIWYMPLPILIYDGLDFRIVM